MENTTLNPRSMPFERRRYDNKFATFWWEIYLDMNWTGPNGECHAQPMLPGYSKKWGADEPKDKNEVLMGVIDRVASKYLRKGAIAMKIYRRGSEIIDKESDPLILTLTPDKADPAPSLLTNFEMMHFLNRFYKMLLSGQDVKMLRPPKRSNFSKEEYLDIDIQHTRIIRGDSNRLSAYIERLLANGHPAGAIVHFFNSYKAKYLR